MGVFRMFSSSSLPNQPQAPQNNPNPSNFIIIKSYDRRDYCAVMVRYPDCNNYEGSKILVFNEPLEKIIRQTVLDPHFTDKPGPYCVPIARFEPTEQGWSDAEEYIFHKTNELSVRGLVLEYIRTNWLWDTSWMNTNNHRFEYRLAKKEVESRYQNYIAGLTDEQLFNKMWELHNNADYWPQA